MLNFKCPRNLGSPLEALDTNLISLSQKKTTITLQSFSLPSPLNFSWINMVYNMSLSQFSRVAWSEQTFPSADAAVDQFLEHVIIHHLKCSVKNNQKAFKKVIKANTATEFHLYWRFYKARAKLQEKCDKNLLENNCQKK